MPCRDRPLRRLIGLIALAASAAACSSAAGTTGTDPSATTPTTRSTAASTPTPTTATVPTPTTATVPTPSPAADAPATSAPSTVPPASSSANSGTMPTAVVPAASVPTAPAVAAGGANVLVVGDSSLAGVRWYDGASERLRGATFVLDAESCRRVAVPSCGGREQRIPANVVQRILQAQPREFDAIVVMSGYNDDGIDFERAVGEVFGAARTVGAERIVFLTLTTPDPQYSGVRTMAQNDALRAFRPTDDPTAGGWFVADWQQYSAPFADRWYELDRVHLSPTGAYAVADYISNVVAHALGLPCPGAPTGTCPLPRSPSPEAAADFDSAPRVRCLEVGQTRELVCEPTP